MYILVQAGLYKNFQKSLPFSSPSVLVLSANLAEHKVTQLIRRSYVTQRRELPAACKPGALQIHNTRNVIEPNDPNISNHSLLQRYAADSHRCNTHDHYGLIQVRISEYVSSKVFSTLPIHCGQNTVPYCFPHI